jgi:hypothetical protein
MKIGNIIHVIYDTGEVFTGELVSIREIEDKGTLLLVNDETVGYRSVYQHKIIGDVLYREAGMVHAD